MAVCVTAVTVKPRHLVLVAAVEPSPIELEEPGVVLLVAVEHAFGFGEAVLDQDDEAIFREALAPKIKTIDSAALRAGHWT